MIIYKYKNNILRISPGARPNIQMQTIYFVFVNNVPLGDFPVLILFTFNFKLIYNFWPKKKLIYNLYASFVIIIVYYFNYKYDFIYVISNRFCCFYSRFSYHLDKLDCISEFNCNIFILTILKFWLISYLHIGSFCLRNVNIFYENYV